MCVHACAGLRILSRNVPPVPEKNEFRVISEQVVRADSIPEACLTQNLAIDTGDWVFTGDALQSLLERGLKIEAGRSIVAFTPPYCLTLWVGGVDEEVRAC